MTKDEVNQCLIDNRGYIKAIVWDFLRFKQQWISYRDDLNSHCYIEFLRVMPNYRPSKGTLQQHIYAQMTYACQHFLRDEIVEMQKRDLYELLQTEFDDPFDTESFEATLKKARCTENQKAVLRCIFINGNTFKEVAEVLRISDSSVHRTYKRALKRIKDDIEFV
jgi:RNA polymerase sigma factor (sigma-70 family)